MNDAAAIFQAVKDGDMSVVERHLTADPRLVHARDEYLKTPLHWAAEHDRCDVAQMLLDSDADLEATTSWGDTALDWSATMGSTKVADLLLARGAKGMNLVVAACLGKLDLVREFLDSGTPLASLAKPAPAEPDDHWVADSARMKGNVISHAFYCACRNGQTAVAALLLDAVPTSMQKGSSAGRACIGRRSMATKIRSSFLWCTAPISPFGIPSSIHHRRGGQLRASTTRYVNCSIARESYAIPGSPSIYYRHRLFAV